MITDEALNDRAEIPPELDRWNWGAFFLNWILLVGYSTRIALLALIPLVNMVMMFVRGFRGSRRAWKTANGAALTIFAGASVAGASRV